MGTVRPSSIDIKMGLYTLMFISRPLNIKENDGLNTYMYMCKLPPLQSLVYNTLGGSIQLSINVLNIQKGNL